MKYVIMTINYKHTNDLPLICNVANASELKFENDDVAVHLYWPCCCGRTELMVRDLPVVRTKFDNSHLYEKSSCPIAEQTNVTLSNTLAVVLLGLMVTTGGVTKSIKYYQLTILF